MHHYRPSSFYVITLWTCTMLTDCYHVKGKRHTRYKWAVLHIMGPAHSVVLAVCQNMNMVRCVCADWLLRACLQAALFVLLARCSARAEAGVLCRCDSLARSVRKT